MPIAALIGIDLVTGEVIKQIFSQKDGEENPIAACELLRTKMEALLENFTFTIVANNQAREVYAAQMNT